MERGTWCLCEWSGVGGGRVSERGQDAANLWSVRVLSSLSCLQSDAGH